MNYFEQIKKVLPIILAIGFIVFVIFYEPNIQNSDVEDSIIDTNIVKNDCMGMDVFLGGAKEKLGNNETALNILQDNCLWLLDYKNDDFDSDQKNELAMITGGVGCGSCHWNVLFIIKDNRVIFEKEQEDINIWAVKDIGFAIKYPIRKEGEPMCCPSEGIVESYKAKNVGNIDESFDIIGQKIEEYPIR